MNISSDPQDNSNNLSSESENLPKLNYPSNLEIYSLPAEEFYKKLSEMDIWQPI